MKIDYKRVRKTAAAKAQAEKHPVWEIYFRSWVLPMMWISLGIGVCLLAGRWLLSNMPTMSLSVSWTGVAVVVAVVVGVVCLLPLIRWAWDWRPW